MINEKDLRDTGFDILEKRELEEIFGQEEEKDWKFEKDQNEDRWLKD